MELPSKRLLSIPLLNEEGGDMITMKQFMSLIKKRLSKKVKFLMVGDRRICMHEDSSRSVHYFLLDNCPWYVHTSAELSAEPQLHSRYVFISGLKGERFTVNLDACETVSEVKEQIEDHCGITAQEQRLIMSGRELQHCDSTSMISSGATIFLVLRLCGGGGCASYGMPFADVTHNAGPTMLEWSETAPEWRRAYPGMALEGKCTNRRCKAHKKMVIMNQKFAEFDFINEGHTCQCPICGEHVVPTTCAFNNCQWKVVGRKVSELGQRPQTFSKDWESVGDKYARFSPKRNGTAHFLDLKILCRKAAQSQVCAVCARQINLRNQVKVKCGHIFHAGHCFDVGSTTDRNCIECTSRDNMTRYQIMFGS